MCSHSAAAGPHRRQTHARRIELHGSVPVAAIPGGRCQSGADARLHMAATRPPVPALSQRPSGAGPACARRPLTLGADKVAVQEDTGILMQHLRGTGNPSRGVHSELQEPGLAPKLPQRSGSRPGAGTAHLVDCLSGRWHGCDRADHSGDRRCPPQPCCRISMQSAEQRARPAASPTSMRGDLAGSHSVSSAGAVQVVAVVVFAAAACVAAGPATGGQTGGPAAGAGRPSKCPLPDMDPSASAVWGPPGLTAAVSGPLRAPPGATGAGGAGAPPVWAASLPS